ncbi:MAG: hypothetical protein IKH66_02095, partial [Campylobacter sp.]|nr:hypothetical protein [Campylobacter sp.]
MKGLDMENDIFNKNKNLRDYDKEPLVLRNYASPALAFNFLLIFAFWVTASLFILNKFDEFEYGYLEIGETIQTIITFGFIMFFMLLLDFLNISNMKSHYTYFYNSKAVFYNHKNQVDETIHFRVMGDRIVLCNPYDNPISYDISH